MKCLNIVDSLLHSMMNLQISPIENLLIKLYLNSVHLATIMDDYVESSLVSLQNKLDNNDISVAMVDTFGTGTSTTGTTSSAVSGSTSGGSSGSGGSGSSYWW